MPSMADEEAMIEAVRLGERPRVEKLLSSNRNLANARTHADDVSKDK